MTLELTREEQDIIRELVSQELADLGPEIHHTRTRVYRDELKRRKRTLERLAERLGALAPADEQPAPEPSETRPETTAQV